MRREASCVGGADATAERKHRGRAAECCTLDLSQSHRVLPLPCGRARRAFLSRQIF